jgi:Ferritin-like
MIHLQAQLFAELRSRGPQAVKRSLQRAIELEHSTIPLYLYAIFSLDPTKNGAIAGIVNSVVLEEMLHMTLACNILNALGGSPVIDNPKFIPKYPGPLPGGVESELTVHLAPFHFNQLCDFLTIEEPEHPLDFPVVEAEAAIRPPETIGQFYREIERQIRALGDGAFSSAPRNQIGPDVIDGAIIVTDVASAANAINTIVHQGEGTKESPLEAVTSGDFAHYYRFSEIYNGKRLIKNPDATADTPPDEQYVYGGDPVSFDRAGVYPVPTDPATDGYPAGSAERHACQTFNYAYTSLLRALHAGFNGQPDQIGSAIGLMFSLAQLGKDMMSGINPAGKFVGPSFEYQPTDPS